MLDPEPIDFAGVAYADPDFVDADVIGGANLIQDFKLAMGSLHGTLTFEDGSSQPFTIGDSLQLANASAIDAAGNDNGDVNFTLNLTPNADLTNDSSVGLNIGFHLKLLSVELGYDIGVDSGSTTLGPLYEETWTAPVAEIPVYSNTFNLAFSDGNYAFAA